MRVGINRRYLNECWLVCGMGKVKLRAKRRSPIKQSVKRKTRFKPIGWAKCEQLRHAVDCAPYQRSAPLRLCVENADESGHAHLP